MNVFISFQVSPCKYFTASISPDVNLLTRRQSGGPEAGDLPGHVGVPHVVGQAEDLHVECLLQPAVKAGQAIHLQEFHSLRREVEIFL